MATRLDRLERQNAIQNAETANQLKILTNLIKGLIANTPAMANPSASPNRILNLNSPLAEETSSSRDIPVHAVNHSPNRILNLNSPPAEEDSSSNDLPLNNIKSVTCNVSNNVPAMPCTNKVHSGKVKQVSSSTVLDKPVTMAAEPDELVVVKNSVKEIYAIMSSCTDHMVYLCLTACDTAAHNMNIMMNDPMVGNAFAKDVKDNPVGYGYCIVY